MRVVCLTLFFKKTRVWFVFARCPSSLDNYETLMIHRGAIAWVGQNSRHLKQPTQRFWRSASALWVRWFTWNTPMEHISTHFPHPLQKIRSTYTSIRSVGEGLISKNFAWCTYRQNNEKDCWSEKSEHFQDLLHRFSVEWKKTPLSGYSCSVESLLLHQEAYTISFIPRAVRQKKSCYPYRDHTRG